MSIYDGLKNKYGEDKLNELLSSIAPSIFPKQEPVQVPLSDDFNRLKDPNLSLESDMTPEQVQEALTLNRQPATDTFKPDLNPRNIFKPSDVKQKEVNLSTKVDSIPKEEPKSEQAPIEPKVIDFGKGSESTVGNLKALQDRQKQAEDLAFYSKLGNTIGGALSHASKSVIKDNEQLINDAAQGPTKDLERFSQRVAMEKKDPNSPYSVGLKDYIKKQYGIEIRGDISGEDLEKSGVMKQVADNYEKDKYQNFLEKQQQDRLAEQRERFNLQREDQKIQREQIAATKETQRNDRLDKEKRIRDTELEKKVERATKTTEQAVRKHHETLAAIDRLDALAKNAVEYGGQSLAMLGPTVAKGLAGEVGVLTEADVTRYITHPALAQKAQDILLKAKSGKLSNVSYENLMMMANIMKAKTEDARNQMYLRGATQLSRNSNLSLEEAYSKMNPDFNIGDELPQLKSTGSTDKKQSQEDKEAIEWAKNNPNDPRAQAILSMHGTK